MVDLDKLPEIKSPFAAPPDDALLKPPAIPAIHQGFPSLTDVGWLALLMAVAQALRIVAWHVKDAETRVVVLEGLLGAETLAVGFVFCPRRAIEVGTHGVAVYLLSWFLIRLYRLHCVMNEAKGNPAEVLEATRSKEQWMQLATLMLLAQFTGGWIGFRYIIRMSSIKEEPPSCTLPVQGPVIQSVLSEAMGSFAVQMATRTAASVDQWSPFLLHFAVFTVTKLSAVKLSGSSFNPLAASVMYFKCFVDKDNVAQFLIIYIVSPCLGTALAVILAPYALGILDKCKPFIQEILPTLFMGEELRGRSSIINTNRMN